MSASASPTFYPTPGTGTFSPTPGTGPGTFYPTPGATLDIVSTVDLARHAVHTRHADECPCTEAVRAEYTEAVEYARARGTKRWFRSREVARAAWAESEAVYRRWLTAELVHDVARQPVVPFLYPFMTDDDI